MVGKIHSLICAVLMAGAVFADGPLVKDIVFVAFDTETTGFSPQNDRLVEIGAVRFRGDGQILAATNWLINPDMPIPFYATEVHGITTAMTTNAPAFSEVWKAFAAFCGDSLLIAHNAPFDIGFLRAELKRAGVDVPPLPVVDSLPLFRVWFPQAPSHALGSLAAYLGADRGVYHRAGADAHHLVDILALGMKSREALPLQELEREAGGVKRLDRKGTDAND